MHTVKRWDIRGNTFGKGWGTIPRTFSPQKSDFGGDLGGWRRPAATLDALWSGRSEGKKGRVGEKGPAAQDIGLVTPVRMARQACRASACGAIGRATSSPSRRSAGSGRQRGHTVAPHAMARQRLSVAPCGLARPNGLRPANKNQYGLNLKYLKKS